MDVKEGYCGYCHDWTRQPAWAVKVRFWYGWPGRPARAMLDEVVLGFDDDPAELAERHGNFVNLMAPENYRPGKAPVYSIDFEFADGEHVRFGNDREVMVEPMDVAPGDFLGRLEALLRQREDGRSG